MNEHINNEINQILKGQSFIKEAEKIPGVISVSGDFVHVRNFYFFKIAYAVFGHDQMSKEIRYCCWMGTDIQAIFYLDGVQFYTTFSTEEKKK